MAKQKKHQWQIALEKAQERLRNQPKLPPQQSPRIQRRSAEEKVASLFGLAPFGFLEASYKEHDENKFKSRY